MTSVLNKLERIERTTGINQPCDVCGDAEGYVRRIREREALLGIPPTPRAEIMTQRVRCAWCLRSHLTDVTALDASGRALFARMTAAMRDGTLCAEGDDFFERVFAASDRGNRARYGAHYDEMKMLIEEMIAAMRESCARRPPRLHYLCRVPGCGCDYPKTEGEYLANAKRRAA